FPTHVHRVRPRARARSTVIKHTLSLTMSSANAFVKNEWEIRELEQMPARNFFDVVDPCESCRRSFRFRAGGSKPWEVCMRFPRQCFRKGEKHPLPTIRRVCIDELNEDRDFACVFETDGSDTVAWRKETTRCRVACDKCWNLAQCTRMKHTLDPHSIAFLDIDDAPGVTPAKRSCKNSSPSGSAKSNQHQTPTPDGRATKQARMSPCPSRLATGSRAATRLSPKPSRLVTGPRAAIADSSPPATARTPTPRPPTPSAASATTRVGGARRLSLSRSSSTRSNGGRGGGGGEGGGGSPPLEADKGKRPARRPQQQESTGAGGAASDGGGGGGAGGESRSQSPDVAAGTGAAVKFQAVSRGSDIYIERLREKVQSAAGGVKDASKHLEDLTKVKQHARAQIRDAERLLKMSEQKEQQVKAQLVIFKTEEAASKNELKDALKGSAEKLKEEAARLIREVR
ncbi:unnamed protein product, partial [Pylaiella littoralis]